MKSFTGAGFGSLMMRFKKEWSMPRFFLSVEKEHRGGSWDSTTSSNGVLVRKLKKSYDPV
jgi:hypothetical protein